MAKTYTTADLHRFRERTGVPTGHIRAQIAGHGQYQCTAKAFDAMLELYWDRPLSWLYGELKERHGDPEYDCSDLTRVEAIMILQELEGHATN
jgi:hypothetical protein